MIRIICLIPAKFDTGTGSKAVLFLAPYLKSRHRPNLKTASPSASSESVLLNCDGKRVTEQNVRASLMATERLGAPRKFPFVVARIVLQDFTGFLCSSTSRLCGPQRSPRQNPKIIKPLVPVDLVVGPFRSKSISSARPTPCSET